ncbi:MAG: hypothetical protein VZQ62_03500 [Methanosphaera sp.]|jgi:hypothetical protein|nr:hypothetical protein [Methanosphaera sp.]
MKKYDTTTKITNFNVNWQAIKSACMTTISKQAGDKEPSKEWKRKLLICRHSPIRRGIISWKWENIPYAISTHFARHHEGCEKFIGTERTDRTNIDREQRSQMNYVPMEMDANIQALMSIAERRLCMCADPTTREYMEALVEEIRKYDEDIAWSLVPQCVRCGGCVEPFSNCQYYDSIYDRIPEEARDTVMKRYDIYDKQRVRKLELKRGK